MAQLIRCDECKAERAQTVFGWLTVADASEFYIDSFAGGRRLVGDYCSAKCLAEAATRVAAVQAGSHV